MASPDGEEPLAADGWRHLDVDDVQRLIGDDLPGGVLGIGFGVEQVQRTCRADIEDGQEPGAAGRYLDPHPVAGAEADLVGGRRDLLHVAGQSARRLLLMGRGYRLVAIRPDLAADDQAQSTGAGRCGSGSVGGWPGGFEPAPGEARSRGWTELVAGSS